MSLTCALSGEPLATTKEDIVVTPTGHVCIKRLLLQKITENGGMDPFEQIREIPLQEDQLVLLKSSASGSSATPPPRPQVTSLPNLLQNIQTEYDALVLELFDTRKALEETRKELSQALYQNDAAVRVVARLAQERDTARQELERWNASVGDAGAGADKNSEAVEETDGGGEEPEKKKRRINNEETEAGNDDTTLPLKNDIPSEDYEAMKEAWETSMKERKAKLKESVASAPSKDDLEQYTELDSKAWHKSTCRGLTDLIACGDYIVTAGKDKQVVVYHTEEKVVKHSFSGVTPSCMDVRDNILVIGDAKGKITAYSLLEGGDDGGGGKDVQLDNCEGIVDIRIHTSNKHICAATGNGEVIVLTVTVDGLKQIGSFSNGNNDDDKGLKYTSLAMQPDGLLFVIGTNSGKLLAFDINNKAITSGILPDLDVEDAVVTVAFSNNGYHVASAHESGTVRFWDLKKSKLMASLNEEKDLLDSVRKISYDESGKYVALAGAGGVKLTTVKEWGITASFDVPAKEGKVSGTAWLAGGKDIVLCSDKKRQVKFFGKQES